MMIRASIVFTLLLSAILLNLTKTGVAKEPQGVNELKAPGTNQSPDWPWWRGPTRDGVAAGDQHPPLHWSETENLIWKAEIPGRGHGSPTVVGDRIYLQTAEPDRNVQSVLSYRRSTGQKLWHVEIHKGEFNSKDVKPSNTKSTFANSTIACDGERLFANFLHDGVIYTTALDLNGKQIWQKKITDYVLHQGFASSPAVYKNLVIVSADNKGAGVISALDRATGDVVWSISRPKLPNYTSPILYHVAGRDQLFFFGCGLVTSLDPLTGKTIWEIKGATDECVTSTVTDGNLIFTSGGYPRNHLAAVHADGSGKIAWENGSRVYVPSMLLKDGYLYAVLDAGVATCWKCDSGKEIWKERLGGVFSSSPVLVGDNIFVTNEAGKTFIFKASPDGFSSVAENQLGEEVFATPTICDSRIYLRAASQVDGKRQEFLYCLGEKK